MVTMELNDVEVEALRRTRMSVGERDAEDSARLAASRALALAYANPTERARMEKVAAQPAARLEAYRLVCQYNNLMPKIAVAKKEIGKLAEDVDPLVVVPDELKTVVVKSLASAPEVVTQPEVVPQVAEEAEVAPVKSPGIVKRMVNAVLGR